MEKIGEECVTTFPNFNDYYIVPIKNNECTINEDTRKEIQEKYSPLTPDSPGTDPEGKSQASWIKSIDYITFEEARNLCNSNDSKLYEPKLIENNDGTTKIILNHDVLDPIKSSLGSEDYWIGVRSFNSPFSSPLENNEDDSEGIKLFENDTPIGDLNSAGGGPSGDSKKLDSSTNIIQKDIVLNKEEPGKNPLLQDNSEIDSEGKTMKTAGFYKLLEHDSDITFSNIFNYDYTNELNKNKRNTAYSIKTVDSNYTLQDYGVNIPMKGGALCQVFVNRKETINIVDNTEDNDWSIVKLFGKHKYNVVNSMLPKDSSLIEYEELVNGKHKQKLINMINDFVKSAPDYDASFENYYYFWLKSPIKEVVKDSVPTVNSLEDAPNCIKVTRSVVNSKSQMADIISLSQRYFDPKGSNFVNPLISISIKLETIPLDQRIDGFIYKTPKTLSKVAESNSESSTLESSETSSGISQQQIIIISLIFGIMFCIFVLYRISTEQKGGGIVSPPVSLSPVDTNKTVAPPRRGPNKTSNFDKILTALTKNIF